MVIFQRGGNPSRILNQFGLWHGLLSEPKWSRKRILKNKINLLRLLRKNYLRLQKLALSIRSCRRTKEHGD